MIVKLATGQVYQVRATSWGISRAKFPSELTTSKKDIDFFKKHMYTKINLGGWGSPKKIFKMSYFPRVNCNNSYFPIEKCFVKSSVNIQDLLG